MPARLYSSIMFFDPVYRGLRKEANTEMENFQILCPSLLVVGVVAVRREADRCWGLPSSWLHLCTPLPQLVTALFLFKMVFTTDTLVGNPSCYTSIVLSRISELEENLCDYNHSDLALSWLLQQKLIHLAWLQSFFPLYKKQQIREQQCFGRSGPYAW